AREPAARMDGATGAATRGDRGPANLGRIGRGGRDPRYEHESDAQHPRTIAELSADGCGSRPTSTSACATDPRRYRAGSTDWPRGNTWPRCGVADRTARR